VWEKTRNAVDDHQLQDSVRGATKSLHSNTTGVEDTFPNYLTSFISNGYTFGTGDYATSVTAVDWCWNAGGTTVTNGVGTISSQVRANTTAGFSIVKYTTSTTNSTVGHGLGVAPSMVIVRYIGTVSNWFVYHTSVGAGNYVMLNSTNGQAALSTLWNNTAPTSSVFSVGTAWTAAVDTIAYCWAPVAGYSAFGSYTGNGSADGPFIYTGFRPRWIMVKAITAATAYSWVVLDSSRNTYNLTDLKLAPNSSVVENDAATLGGAGTNAFDFVSNGFKSRTLNLITNESGTTYIYAAFAENPLKYANAR
jgi:hypothetical protein